MGCLPPESKNPKKKDKPKPQPAIVMNTGPGSSDMFATDPKLIKKWVSGPQPGRVKEWTVFWDRLGVGVSQEGAKAGRMLKVRAKIYSGKNAGSTVVADSGEGSKETHQLLLEGNVVVTAPDGKSKLLCDRLRYVAATKRFYASGNVRFINKVATLGTFSQLVATADLKKVATPEEFHQ